MKTDDKDKQKANMVARNSDTSSPFTAVQRHEPQPSQADAMQDEVSAEEAEIEGILDGIRQRQNEVAQKKAQAAEAARSEKLEVRAGLIDDAADWREIARTSPDADRAKDFLRKAKDAEAEAARLGVELNLVDAGQPIAEAPKRLLPLSSNSALQIMGGMFLLCVVLTYIFGHPLEADPMNAIGQSMMKNAPIRALLSFTLTFLTVLVATALIRIVFPQFYRIWHNGIDSERSLESLLNEAPAWAVLLSLLGLFYTFMQLFASFYQALYA